MGGSPCPGVSNSPTSLESTPADNRVFATASQTAAICFDFYSRTWARGVMSMVSSFLT